MLFLAVHCIILHGVVSNGLIVLALLGLAIIFIVLIFLVLILIILSILVDLLLSSLLECLRLLGLESAEHTDDLLNDLEHVVHHGGGQLGSVQGRRQPNDERFPLIGVREALAHLVLK